MGDAYYDHYCAVLRDTPPRPGLTAFVCQCGSAGWADWTEAGLYVEHKLGCKHLVRTSLGYLPAKALHKHCKRAGRNIAFALGLAAVRFASERCGDVDHNCGCSFSCQRPRYVLEAAGMWQPRRTATST